MANSSKRKRRLWDACAFPGFRPQSAVRGIFVDPKARIIEGLNNKIRVIQRRAYGLRDEEYLRLKVLTCMLPAL